MINQTPFVVNVGSLGRPLVSNWHPALSRARSQQPEALLPRREVRDRCAPLRKPHEYERQPSASHCRCQARAARTGSARSCIRPSCHGANGCPGCASAAAGATEVDRTSLSSFSFGVALCLPARQPLGSSARCSAEASPICDPSRLRAAPRQGQALRLMKRAHTLLGVVWGAVAAVGKLGTSTCKRKEQTVRERSRQKGSSYSRSVAAAVQMAA